LSAFNGYGTLQEYKETRQMKKKAFSEREERCLSVMAQVLGASLGMQTARDYLNVTAHFLDAAETRLAEVMAQAEEGVALPSERLSRMAERDEAEVRHINTKYQHQLSMAMLRAVMGVSRVEKEGM
jgi:outer membrane protein TolC